MNPQPYLQIYYETHDEDARLTSRTGQIEYLTTMRYIEKYLKPGTRILEIGAATGRYSHALARMGYQVDALELIDHNIEIFKQNTQPGENITIQQGNATDLSAFEDETYGPRFEPLAEAIVALGVSPTIICECKGTMAEDAGTMRAIYDALK